MKRLYFEDVLVRICLVALAALVVYHRQAFAELFVDFFRLGF